MKHVEGPIDVNVAFALLEGDLSCTAREITLDFNNEEKTQGLVGRFYNGLNFPLLAYLFNNSLWYLGEDSDVAKFIDEFAERHAKVITISEAEEVMLSLRNKTDQRIVEHLLNKQLALLMMEKGFIVDVPRRVAYSGPLLGREDSPPLVHDSKFFECFRYRIKAFSSGVSLQIDPVIRILERQTPLQSGEFLVPACFDSDCPRYADCTESLPKSAVFYENDVSTGRISCPLFETVSVVYDPWRDATFIVPKRALQSRTEKWGLRIRARHYSLKSPEARWLMTSRLFHEISTDQGIQISLGDAELSFDSPFTSIPVVHGKTRPYKGYALAGEVPIVFGDGLKHVDPYEGLKEFGTFSFNKRDPSVPNPDLRVFAVFPEGVSGNIEDMLQKLKEGYFSFPGFHQNKKPFGVELEYISFPIKPRNDALYSDLVKAKLENLKNDYPRRNGDVFLLVIPTGDEEFYYDLKGFSIERSLKTQMLRQRTVDRLRSSWYSLYCFALSLYVSGGATPWRVDSSYFEDVDCYIGLAFSIRRYESNRQRLFLGVADVFDAFGEHLSFALHEGLVPPEIRGLHVDREFMKKIVKKSVLRYQDKMGESPSTLLIHKPGSFHSDELSGLSDVIAETDCDRAFVVHVQHNSLFRAYNQSLDYQSVATTYFRIGPGNAVVFPTGYLEKSGKPHKMGSPKPVQVNVRSVESIGSADNRISDNELHFIIQNLLAFTRLRWSSLSPRIREPITIHAPWVIATWQGKGIKGLDGLDIRDVL